MTIEAGTPRMADCGDKEHKELIRQERAIARKYVGKFPLAMAIWGICNLVCWLALWPLVFTGILPLWVAFPIATVNVILCYLPSHEAQHFEFRKTWRPPVVAQ
jgi:beta-carotene hydroxylase